MRALVLIVAGACAPFQALPTAVHPTPTAADRSVTVAVGGIHVNQEGTDVGEVTAIPHGEGWIRIPVGTAGQLGVHAGPNAGHVGLRFDLGPSIALEPMIGGGYASIPSFDTGMGGDEDQWTLTLSGGINALLLLPTSSGMVYVVPKAAFSYLDSEDQDDETNLYTLGLSVGFDVAGTSIEITVHRVDDLEDEDMPDDEPIWVLAPTIAYRH